MKEIILNYKGKELKVLVDDDDFNVVSKFKWHAHNMHNTGIFYAGHFFKINGKYKYVHMHTFLLDNIGGKLEVDHIDGNGLNNTRKNIRLCTHAENMRNVGKQIKGVNKYKGVYYIKKSGMYRARIAVDNKRLHLGCFVHEHDACVAYNEAAIKYFGEFARINAFISY